MDTSNTWPDLAETKLSQFKSTKTPRPVLYRRRWHRDALIQLTLRPEIHLISNSIVASECECCFCVDVTSGQRNMTIAYSEHDQRSPVCPSELIVSRSYVLAEPRCSSARDIWKNRNFPLSISHRISMLELVTSNCGEVSLRSLLTGSSDSDVLIGTAMRMVCEGHLTLDLDSLITPETLLTLIRR